MPNPRVHGRLVLLLVVTAVSVGCGAPASPRADGDAGRPASQLPTASEPAPESRVAPEELRRDLAGDERRGGHTIARHVGKSDADLRARLAREPRISAASTYTSLEIAERVVARTLADERPQVERWERRQGRRPNLAIDYRGREGQVIGRSIRRGRGRAEDCHDAVVVLRWDEDAGDYFVLTSYPEGRR